MREDQAADGGDAAATTGLLVAEVGPLRGEKPKESHAVEIDGPGQAAVAAGRTRLTVVDGRGAPQQQGRRVADLPDLRLRVALAPVAWLWAQLTRGQQGVARRAVEQGLKVLDGIAGPESAPRLLADRLTDRLEEAGGEALVREPLGWLLGRGLVQRQACTDLRCDDGIRLDTGASCEMCSNQRHVRRAWRAKITAEVDTQMPGTDPAMRQTAIEERLRHQVALEAENVMWRRQQAEAGRARRQAARAKAEVEQVRAAGPALRGLRCGPADRAVRGVRLPA
ncbi:hypothetical protein J7I98_39365 [Streptomyces sp. ISL-98]|uniref:hypothetical protein n=1 Tax=Streptomyces sp. ISL-98 TaxID=2819192 RepID=UPI001BE7EC5B|nr:hypothetical protein [Streptomyces sp. ISL-98]MBT2511730.1 hypothetical protein [Streptomyces sp. ISL-98]